MDYNRTILLKSIDETRGWKQEDGKYMFCVVM